MKVILATLLSLLLGNIALAADTVNINTASAAEIADALTGVGMVTAERIVQYREENGAFAHADELVNVKGIGLKLLDKNRDRIQVDAPAPAEDR